MASEQHHPDGWLQDGSLLYRLTDDAHPVNRDEINVAMADGSRSAEARARRAGELLDSIRAGQAALFAAADTSELPKVPDSVLCYVHAYGDSRADDDGRSGLRIGELILALRRWAKSIAAPTTQAARLAYAEMPDERAAFEALARTEWRWPDDFFWRHSQTHEYTREPAMSAWIAWQAALRASHGQAPVAHGDALDEVRRAVAAIAVVGHVDGHAVVRRLSVLDMLDRRIAARAQAKEGGA